MSNKSIIVIIIIVLVLIGGGIVIYKNNSAIPAPTTSTDTKNLPNNMNTKTPPPTPSQDQSSQTTPPADTTSAATGTSKEFTVSGQNFSFSLATMTVKKGDRVRITFKNSGGTHEFIIDEFNVATKRLNGGEQDAVEFTADKTGSFEYYCSVGSPRAMGMKGTLVVE